jgi:hypothetical protein
VESASPFNLQQQQRPPCLGLQWEPLDKGLMLLARSAFYIPSAVKKNHNFLIVAVGAI